MLISLFGRMLNHPLVSNFVKIRFLIGIFTKKLSADEFLEVIEELESGMNLDQIARMHGTCRKALEERLVRHGILRPSQKDQNKLIM